MIPNGWIEYMTSWKEPPQAIIDELEERKAIVQQTREFELRQKREAKANYIPVIQEVRSYSARKTKGGSRE